MDACTCLVRRVMLQNLQLDLNAFVCYQENSDRYPAINDAQQKIPNGQYRSTWNEKGVFFFTSLGFTTGNVGC